MRPSEKWSSETKNQRKHETNTLGFKSLFWLLLMSPLMQNKWASKLWTFKTHCISQNNFLCISNANSSFLGARYENDKVTDIFSDRLWKSFVQKDKEKKQRKNEQKSFSLVYVNIICREDLEHFERRKICGNYLEYLFCKKENSRECYATLTLLIHF